MAAGTRTPPPLAALRALEYPEPPAMVIFSGIQPTGRKHLGNYIGAILQYVEGQDRADPAIYCIVDLHGTTVAYEPAELRERTRDTAALLVAAGLDPERCVLFRQSDVPEHTELTWLLSSVTSVGQLNRMHQFRDKAGAARERASAGTAVLPGPDGRRRARLPRPRGAGGGGPARAHRADARRRGGLQQALRRDARRPRGQHPDGRRPDPRPQGARQEDVDHRRHARRAGSTSTRSPRASSRSSSARRPTPGARSCAPTTSPASRT